MSIDSEYLHLFQNTVLLDLAEVYSIEKIRQALGELKDDLGHEGEPVEAPEKRSRDDSCPELRALAASCVRVQPAFAEPCTWHHACQTCASVS